MAACAVRAARQRAGLTRGCQFVERRLLAVDHVPVNGGRARWGAYEPVVTGLAPTASLMRSCQSRTWAACLSELQRTSRTVSPCAWSRRSCYVPGAFSGRPGRVRHRLMTGSSAPVRCPGVPEFPRHRAISVGGTPIRYAVMYTWFARVVCHTPQWSQRRADVTTDNGATAIRPVRRKPRTSA